MMSGAWSEVVSLLEHAVGAGRVSPAAALLVGRGERILFEHSAGVAGPGHDEHSCDRETVFDVASLTKPLVTAAIALDMIARGHLYFDTRVVDVLPAFGAGPDERRAAVSVRHLLRHDAGLPAHRRFYEQFPASAPDSPADLRERRAQMVGLALAEPLERDPRAGSVYSDIGFMVLGALVEEIGGARIDELAASRIFAPLKLEDAWFVETTGMPDEAFAKRCAGTGPCAWRHVRIHGVVQDENAYAMGGIAAHAGLFATARTVHRLVAEWEEALAGRGRVLDRRIVGHAWNRAASAAGAAPSTWALGWDTPTAGGSSAGSRIGRDAVGHLGYTGTSAWIDPSRRVHVVLLTNRIAYGTSKLAIQKLRPRIHDAVFSALDRVKI